MNKMAGHPAVYLFAGPSAHGTPYQDRAAGAGLVWRPPARRGDIAALVAQTPVPGIIALADGTFHSYPAVGHAELRQALRSGWTVFGLCSMGAIRASEMQHMGMRPFGQVAARFCADPDLADDEVALSHAAGAPYLPLSEPLLHLRAYLAHMHELGLLDQDEHQALAAHLSARWYAERTLPALRAALQRIARPAALPALLERMQDFGRYRLKQQDLASFVESQPWRTAGAAPTIRPLDAVPCAPAAVAADAPTIALNSSLRLRSAEESLALVEPLARARGVSRVTDTTWLDRLGLPVFAAIRPDAAEETLSVHAGKGGTAAEAKIGAYMEAIEFSYAEYGRSHVATRLATPVDILESFRGQLQFPDFCPSINYANDVSADDQLGVVEAEELLGLGRPVLVPAELVFSPYTDGPGRLLYGASTNGLASGNTVAEATVHALAEVMERDVDAFLKFGAPSYWIDPASLPPRLKSMVERFGQAGMQFHLRYAPNPFGLPHFSGFVLEDADYPAAMASGMGFHCNRDIAATRAIVEAAQSRLTTIHGGRDDLVALHMLFHSMGREREQEAKRALRAEAADRRLSVPFDQVPDVQARTVDEAQRALSAGLRRAGLRHMARVVLTEADCPFQVVRVIVPGAEVYDASHRRVGPRLLRYTTERAPEPAQPRYA
ncbi:MAG TPA: YcaO-like family protein [Telluria sp.]|nr:YcaO-like family protein [Telluria sp.]